jgi:VanZ family protein
VDKKTIWFLVFLSFVLGTPLFWDVRVSEQVGALNGLIAVAAVVFGILGVFVSVLDPVAVLEKRPGELDSPRSQLAQKFSPIWKYAAYAFAAVIAARLLLPNAQNALHTFELLVSWIFSTDVGKVFSEALSQSVVDWIATLLRTLSGIIICFLYLVEISILLLSLLPVAVADTERGANEYEDAVADDASELHHDRR